MSRLGKLDLVKGKQAYQCLKISEKYFNSDGLLCARMRHIPCIHCPMGVNRNGVNIYLHLTNTQLETNHERTNQASNQTGTTPHCE